MCGRYSFVPNKQQQQQLEGLDFSGDIHPSYNIAPTHQAYVITNEDTGVVQVMDWGLVPYWSKDGLNQGKLINARAEGIDEKSSFRIPIRRHRCLVPADSFYEWRAGADKKKIPYRILAADGNLLFMAGIWDVWQGAGGSRRTFSIVTTNPNREVSDLHNRMPVLLTTAAAREAWLSDQTPLEQITQMMHPAPDGFLRIYRVTDRLNSPGSEGPDLHEPVPEDLLLF